MALETSLTFYHTFASLTPDWPTSGLTKSTPSGSSDPSVSGGIGTFGTGSGNVSVTWTLGSGEFIAGGTADFTIATRAKYTTNTSGGNTVVHIGNNATRSVTIKEGSSVTFNHRVYDPASTVVSESDTSMWTLDTYFLIVARRASGVMSVWINGADQTGATNNFGSLDLTSSYEDITLGSLIGGTVDLNGAIDWIAVWDRALSDTEITDNMTEADISAALGLGGETPEIVVPWAQRIIRHSGRFM